VIGYHIYGAERSLM